MKEVTQQLREEHLDLLEKYFPKIMGELMSLGYTPLDVSNALATWLFENGYPPTVVSICEKLAELIEWEGEEDPFGGKAS
jgi:hypothetical protein